MISHEESRGGIETLFENKKLLELDPCEGLITLKDLIHHLAQQCQKTELFLKDDTVRPGILVLVNDADWELEGMEEYVLEERDRITFISTLHGG